MTDIVRNAPVQNAGSTYYLRILQTHRVLIDQIKICNTLRHTTVYIHTKNLRFILEK